MQKESKKDNLIYSYKLEEKTRDYFQSIFWLYNRECRNILDCLVYNLDYSKFEKRAKELLCQKYFINKLILDEIKINIENDARWEIDFIENEVRVYGI